MKPPLKDLLAESVAAVICGMTILALLLGLWFGLSALWHLSHREPSPWQKLEASPR